MSKQASFCVNALIGEILQGYVQQPDYSELREEIQKHEYATLRLPQDECKWFVLLYVTSDTVVIQEAELTFDQTRFKVHIVNLAEWNGVFCKWLDEDDERYFDVDACYRDGMRMYGADV